MFYFLGKVFSAIGCFLRKICLKIEYGKRIKFGKNVRFRKGFHVVIVGKDARLVIGDNTFFNIGCSIACLGKITIGKNNAFGEYVTIYDHNHIFNKKEMNQKAFSISEVEIGDDNWICSKVNICAKSKVGNRCVISACTNYSNKVREDFMLYRGEHKEEIKINN